MEDTTEDKIKNAARILFLEKGFKSTSIREIAEVAKVNSAMLHYYFRSKEKLFEVIMLDSMIEIMLSIKTIASDTSTSLSQKIDLMVERYFNLMHKNPRLFPFVIEGLSENSAYIINKSGIPNKLLIDSYLFQQLNEHFEKKGLNISPIHVILNMISMSIMPFAAKPLVLYLSNMNPSELNETIEERKKLIPMWIKTIFEIND